MWLGKDLGLRSVSQYTMVYCDIGAGLRQSVLQYTDCVVTEASLKANGNCITIHKLYCNQKEMGCRHCIAIHSGVL